MQGGWCRIKTPIGLHVSNLHRCGLLPGDHTFLLAFCSQLPCVHFPPTSAISPLRPPRLGPLLPSLSVLGAPGSPVGPALPLPPHCSGDSSHPQAFKTIPVLMAPRCPFSPFLPGPHTHIQPTQPSVCISDKSLDFVSEMGLLTCPSVMPAVSPLSVMEPFQPLPQNLVVVFTSLFLILYIQFSGNPARSPSRTDPSTSHYSTPPPRLFKDMRSGHCSAPKPLP